MVSEGAAAADSRVIYCSSERILSKPLEHRQQSPRQPNDTVFLFPDLKFHQEHVRRFYFACKNAIAYRNLSLVGKPAFSRMIIPKRNLNQARAYLHPFSRAISVSLVSRSGWMRTPALLKTERNTYGAIDPPVHPDRRPDGVDGCPCCAEQAPIRNSAALDSVAAILRSHPKMEGRHLGGAGFSWLPVAFNG